MATLSTGYVNAPMGLSLGSSGPSALPNHFTTDSLVYKFTGGTNAGSITGNVYSGGVPVARTVSVWDQDSKAFIGDAVSDATTGAFTVSGLNPSKVYFVSVADMVDTPFGLHQFGVRTGDTLSIDLKAPAGTSAPSRPTTGQIWPRGTSG
ncbi:hypothetical protein SAMN02949497_2018 [Methylomagnum ishizawai]|uniref:Uncharacterized protein n=1 Tax=Methylomagnum ishizawai TaxID=1760988 RepID=A0A1Y6CWH0_9GAMM|nr:hypothetical protein [Methylomagnum ishizawai]SMF94687.1 hypothetical protein SAMN02949497_2018 [Methylomagnum ishizawai]